MINFTDKHGFNVNILCLRADGVHHRDTRLFGLPKNAMSAGVETKQCPSKAIHMHTFLNGLNMCVCSVFVPIYNQLHVHLAICTYTQMVD